MKYKNITIVMLWTSEILFIRHFRTRYKHRSTKRSPCSTIFAPMPFCHAALCMPMTRATHATWTIHPAKTIPAAAAVVLRAGRGHHSRPDYVAGDLHIDCVRRRRIGYAGVGRSFPDRRKEGCVRTALVAGSCGSGQRTLLAGRILAFDSGRSLQDRPVSRSLGCAGAVLGSCSGIRSRLEGHVGMEVHRTGCEGRRHHVGYAGAGQARRRRRGCGRIVLEEARNNCADLVGCHAVLEAGEKRSCADSAGFHADQVEEEKNSCVGSVDRCAGQPAGMRLAVRCRSMSLLERWGRCGCIHSRSLTVYCAVSHKSWFSFCYLKITYRATAAKDTTDDASKPARASVTARASMTTSIAMALLAAT